MDDSLRLVDVGERRLIDFLFKPRYDQAQVLPRFGDDCAYVADAEDLGGGVVVATTDPCPEPMAAQLGYGNYYYRGWLTAAINLSDLAAAGARPLGVMTSLVLPNDMLVRDFKALIDGIDACCSAVGTKVLGGNLKEGKRIDTQATAIGVCRPGKAMSRRGCRPQDVIVVVGDLGHFWAGVLAKRSNMSLDAATESKLLRNVLTPLPKVSIGYDLANRALLTCCMDNSDGLFPSLAQLSETNEVQFRIDFSTVTVCPEVCMVAAHLDMDPIRLMLGWGDWQLVGCAERGRLDELKSLAAVHGVPVHVIGEVVEGSGVQLLHDGHEGPMVPLDSQRFTRDSWFTDGIESYIASLKDGPLWRK